MARFLLLDPWLDGVGGHNYQYACDVLHAAGEQGFEPWLAANARFAAADTAMSWPVLTPFHYQSTSRYWLGPDGHCRHALDLEGRPLRESGPTRFAACIAERFADAIDWHANDRGQRIATYARDLDALFQEVGFRDDDVIFLPSLSEFDFLGLVRFLRATPASRRVHWHLQFHFDVFAGRQHEYAAQEDRRLRFRRQFAAALATIPEHPLHFYATTELIGDQYDRLEVGRFEPLPYPAGRDVRPPDQVFHDGPLRVTCAGAVRREKGRATLARLIREDLAERLEDGTLQFILHADRKALRRVLSPAQACRTRMLTAPDSQCREPIVPISFPLPRDAYRQLIQQADVGLFLYDARRYHARCSGVLVEMLAAGVPVVVPAGCWLSDQVEAANYAYLAELVEPSQAAVTSITGSDQLIETPWSARAAVIRFRPPAGNRHPQHVRVRTQTFDRHGNLTGPPQQAILGTGILGTTASGNSDRSSPCATLVRIAPGSERLRVTLGAAYGDQSFEPRQADVGFLFDEVATAPRGAIGLVAAEPGQVGELLEEITSHYGHYRERALAHSVTWRREHAPARTVERLAAATASIAANTAASPATRHAA